MKYCLSSRQTNEYLAKADEIKVKYRDRDIIYDFSRKYPTATIILELPVDGSEPNWQEIDSFYRVTQGNLIICIANLKHGEACKACGKCIETCPNKLIELVPYTATVAVTCSSPEKGKEVRLVCGAGCIGCSLCVRQCEDGAITVTNNLAVIDYSLCTSCGLCAAVCPKKLISTPIDTPEEVLAIVKASMKK